MTTPPFYGTTIDRQAEQEKIEQVLAKYLSQPADDDLRRTIYEELMHQKHLGNILVPFTVSLRIDPTGEDAPYVEVTLDSKV